MQHFMYIIIVAILSIVISCLIFLCLNNRGQQRPGIFAKSQQENGMSEQQKRLILVIVFAIFFVSMLMASIKAGRFDSWVSESSKATSSIISTVKKIASASSQTSSILTNHNFIGLNDNQCKINNLNDIYPTKSFDKIETIVSQIKTDILKSSFSKVSSSFMQGSASKLTTLQSPSPFFIHRQQIAFLAKTICQSIKQRSEQPKAKSVLFLDLQEQTIDFKQFLKENQFPFSNYSMFRDQICRINNNNNIASTSTEQTLINNNYDDNNKFNQQQHQQQRKYQDNSLTIIINNFQNIMNTLIIPQFNIDQKLKYLKLFKFKNPQQQSLQQQKYYNNNEYSSAAATKQQQNNHNNNQLINQIHHFYEQFIDLLFNDLVYKCNINFVLVTQKVETLVQLRNRWRFFNEQRRARQRVLNKVSSSNELQLQVRQFPSIQQKQLVQIIKQNLNKYPKYQKHINYALQHLKNKYFNSNNNNRNAHQSSIELLSMTSVTEYLIFIEDMLYSIIDEKSSSEQNISPTEDSLKHQKYYTSSSSQSSSQSTSTSTTFYKQQHSTKQQMNPHQESMFSLSRRYNLHRQYKKLKNMKNIQLTYVKRQIKLDDLLKLEKLRFITIKNGRISFL